MPSSMNETIFAITKAISPLSVSLVRLEATRLVSLLILQQKNIIDPATEERKAYKSEYDINVNGLRVVGELIYHSR